MEGSRQNFINLGVVTNNKGEVLVVKRKKPEEGKEGRVLTWAFPGGRIKGNESRAECISREVLAETGYQVTSIKEVSLRFHPDLPVIVVYHLCALTSPQQVSPPSEPWEIEEVKWVRPEELKTLFTTSLDPKVAAELKIA